MNASSGLPRLATLVLVGLAPWAQAGELTLAVANSTCDAMTKAGTVYQASHPVQINYICKSSGLLVKGLQGGALQADIYVSADKEWMDFAVDNGLVERKQVISPWGNALVVAAPSSSSRRHLDWAELASDRVPRILIGDPSNAPFGRYAKDALENSGLWQRVKDKIETRKNVQLLAESLAEADSGTVGILFRSNLTDRIREVHVVRPSLHAPIRYYLAPLATASGNAEVAGFIRFLRGKTGRRIFRADGFILTPS